MARRRQSGKKKTSQQIHKQNLSNLSSSIEADLNNPNTIAILGQDPIYIHSAKANAEIGLKIVSNNIENILTLKINEVRKELNNWVSELYQREQDLYKQIKPYNENSSPNDIYLLQRWWKQVITNNPNTSFNDFVNSFFSLKQAAFSLWLLNKDNREAKMPELQKEANQSMKKVQSYLESTIKKANKEAKTILKEYQNSLGEIIKKGNDGQEYVDLSKIGKIQSTLGLIYEWIGEQGSKYLQNEYGIKIARWAQELVGDKDQAASDLKLTIGTLSVGLSAKLRKLNVKENNIWTTKLRFGSIATGSSVENYFNNNPNSAFNLTQEEISQINYTIANWRSFSPIGNSSQFQQNLMQLMAWNKVIFGFLGMNYKTAQYPPVFLVSFDEIIPMRWLLSYILSLSDKDILNNITSSTGSWQTKKTITGDRAKTLYNAKKTAIQRMKRKQQFVTYSKLKNQILPTLSGLGIETGNISVKYKILVQNFNSLQKYN